MAEISNKPIRVLIVDDSALVRNIISEKLSEYPDIEIAGTAVDPFDARDKILQTEPDVITLDIEMPRMDGLSFLERLITYFPIPVIIVSSVTTADPKAVIRALEIGAFEVVNKPSGNLSAGEVINEIYRNIVAAGRQKENYIARRQIVQKNLQTSKRKVTGGVARKNLGSIKTTDKMVVIGSSTGGTIAIETILSRLHLTSLPILIVQHMPPGYTNAFAERLNTLCVLNVKEAEEGEIITPGTVYIAGGGRHMMLRRKGASLYIAYDDGEKVNYQKPAVDVLFFSAAEITGKNTGAYVLTGMGSDGARGLLAIKNAGGYTVVQDEASSIVYGMPKAAYDLNAHIKELALNTIAQDIAGFEKGKH